MKNYFLKFGSIILAGCLALLSVINVNAQQETPPSPAAPRSVKFPQPIEKTLENGLRVIVISRPQSLPLVTIKAMVKTGSEADPAQLAGLADATAELLKQGTKTRTAPQIAEAIEALGGSLETNSNWDASTAEVDVINTKTSAAMEILADVVRRPAFATEEIERLRQQKLDELSVALSEPGTLARFVASRVLYADAPYAHPVSGTPESIARLKREDFTRLHETYYRPDNTLLLISGHITADEGFNLAEKYFGDWKKPSAALPVEKSGEKALSAAAPTTRVVVVDKPDAGQAAVLLVRQGLKRADPDYYRAMVANSILGGGFSARLNQEIRIKRGLSYGASSRLDVRREVGPFVAATQTKNVSGAEVASLLIDELKRLASDPIPENELTPRKAALIGGQGRQLETNDGIVNLVGSLALYGLNLGEINDYVNNVQSVTASDVQRFAQSRLGAQGASIVIVGNAKEFLEDLRRKFPQVEVIPVTDLDLNGASLRRAKQQAAAANNQ